MAGPQSLALQLEQLLNPRPREADPEADPEEGEACWGQGHVRSRGPGPVRTRAVCEGPAAGPRRLAYSPSPCAEENCFPGGWPPGQGRRASESFGILRTRVLDLVVGWAERPEDSGLG